MPNGTTSISATTAPQQLGVTDLVKRWALWQGLAVAAYGFALNRLPLPVWIQPWLTILWVMPIVSIIREAWPHYAKGAARLIFGSWIIGSLALTFPLMQREFEGAIAKRNARAFSAYQRAAVDFWLRFATIINPNMLWARGALFDVEQKLQDAVGMNLENEMRDLNGKFMRNEISTEDYRVQRLAIAEKIATWSESTEVIRSTVLDRRRTSGPFGVPYTIWTLALLGLTISAKSLPGSQLGQFLTMAIGGLLTMAYLGAAIPEIKTFFSGYSQTQLLGVAFAILVIGAFLYPAYHKKSFWPVAAGVFLLPLALVFLHWAGQTVGIVPTPPSLRVAVRESPTIQRDELTYFRFWNKRVEPVSLYWINSKGEEELMKTVPARVLFRQPSYLDSRWVIRDVNGNELWRDDNIIPRMEFEVN